MNFTVNHVLTYRMKKRFSFVTGFLPKKKKKKPPHRNTLSLFLVLVCFLLPNEERSINFISGTSAVSGRFVRVPLRLRGARSGAGPSPSRGSRSPRGPTALSGSRQRFSGRVSAAAAPGCVLGGGRGRMRSLDLIFF